MSGILYKKEKRKRNVFTDSEIKKLEKTDIKKWKDLKIAFLFSYKTGTKLNVIEELKWRHIKRLKDNTYYYKIKKIKKNLLIHFPLTQENF